MSETKTPIPPYITPWVLLAVFLIITTGVLVQSDYRQRQKAEFLMDLQTAVQQQSRTENAEMFIKNKPHYDYLSKHQPILNFKLQPIPADAQKPKAISDHQTWCNELNYHSTHAASIISQLGYSGNIDPAWYQTLMINYMTASNCAL